jgi:hypothetical protein
MDTAFNVSQQIENPFPKAGTVFAFCSSEISPGALWALNQIVKSEGNQPVNESISSNGAGLN